MIPDIAHRSHCNYSTQEVEINAFQMFLPPPDTIIGPGCFPQRLSCLNDYDCLWLLANQS